MVMTAAADTGEVFTRRWVVDLILDLAGYTADRDLGAVVAVEPACGNAAFLVPMTERLLAACAQHRRDIRSTGAAIRGYDLSPANVEASRAAVAATLRSGGVAPAVARRLATRWVSPADFLLDGVGGTDGRGRADFVLGNPPYIRLENVAAAKRAAYRAACPTMHGRSDVFVGFIERGLRLLRDGGTLGFIVADRWMRNQYGAQLRAMIGSEFSIEAMIQMHDVDAFHNRVSAYPAVTVIRREAQGPAAIADAGARFGPREAAGLARWVASGRAGGYTRPGLAAARLATWFGGPPSWPSGTPHELAVVADLQARFPPLEDAATGTRIGIGVATGADAVFLTRDADLVEADRLLPFAMAPDTSSGEVKWSGTYLVNPWDDGRLVDLRDYPRLRRYLRAHETVVRARHVARRDPAGWYRTIDKVDPALAQRPKLLLPDIKASIHPVLEPGGLYPHHNLYHVTSRTWDLEVLGGLLLSDVANLMVGAYCVKMRGGCYRFQAQYLRRIRVPDPRSLRAADKRALARAFAGRDTDAATALARRLYGIDPASRRARRTA
jgi:adenine-specific DNA-methyltransferase